MAVPGLIPARAGRTDFDALSEAPDRAHPRSRGADPRAEEVTPGDPGSSPLARGGPRSTCAASCAMGLIPARAGRTPLTLTPVAGPRAHPRSRGADASGGMDGLRSNGSSPLARGGPRIDNLNQQSPGLIPARAGRTPLTLTPVAGPRAHPRSRGADASGGMDGLRSNGSSPLARGGPRIDNLNQQSPGLIPARAGRTTFAAPTRGN